MSTQELALRLTAVGAGQVVTEVNKVGAAVTEAATGAAAGADKLGAALDRVTTSTARVGQATGAAVTGADKLGAALGGVAPAAAAAAAGSERANTALARIGATSAQTAAALRMVPAQFTDIATQLQGGASPLTVLMQQGGQLKDMFGGVAPAARALGGYVLGLVNPFTLAAAAAGGLAWAYHEGANEAQAFRRTVILTGGAAGATASQLDGMAAALGRIGAGTRGRAAEVLDLLASAPAVGADNMQRYTAALLQFERAGGAAAEDMVKTLAGLGQAPLQSALKLNEAQNFLTTSIYRAVQALQEQGRTVEAARVVQDAYMAAVDARTPQLLANLGGVERAWLAIKDAIKGAYDWTLNIGRAPGVQEQIANLQANLRAREKRGQYYGNDGTLPELRAQIGGLQRAGSFQAQLAAEAATTPREIARLEEQRRIREQYASKADKMASELARAGTAYGGDTPDDIAAAIRDKYKERKERKTGTGAQSEAERFTKSLADELAKVRDLNAAYGLGEAALLRVHAARLGVLGASEKTIAAIVAEKDALATRQRADEAAGKSLREAVAAREAYVGALDRSLGSVRDEVQRLADEEEAARLAAASNISLAQAVQQVAVARLQERLDKAQGIEDREAVSKINAEIAARRELIGLIGSREARDANKKAADEAAKTWQTIADQAGQALTDALMSGGRSAADYLKGLFRSLVLRPIIQGVMTPIAGQALGLLGYAQPAGAGSGSVYGQAAQAASLYNSASTVGGWLGYGSAAGAGYGTAAYANAVGAVGGDSLGALYAANNGWAGVSAGSGSAAAGSSASSGAASWGGWALLAAAAVNQAANDWDAGWRREGASQDARNVNTAINPFADMFRKFGDWGILSDKWTDVLSGDTFFARAFGHKAAEVRDQGLTGTLSGGGFSGSAFADVHRDGGWFRHDQDWTETSPLSGELARFMSGAAANVRDQAKAYGEALGLPVASMNSVSQQIRVSLGADAEANKKAITDALAGYGEAIAKGWADALRPLAIYGESASQTVERVAGTLTQVNDILGSLNLTLLSSSIEGGKAAVALTDLFGGLQNMAQAGSAYYERFFDDAAKANLASQKIGGALAAVGLTLPDSIAAFKSVVDGLDLTVEAQRKQYAVLMGVAGAFADMQDAAARVKVEADVRAKAAADALAKAQAETAARAQAAADALAERLRDLASAGQSIAGFVASLRGAVAGASNLAALRRTYMADLAGAQAGNADASGRIVSSAGALVDAVRATATDPVSLARETSRIAVQLQSLPATISYQQQVLDKLAAMVGNTTAGGPIAQALGKAVADARAVLTLTLDSALPQDLKDLALNMTANVQRVVTFVADASGLPADLRNMALRSTSALTTTVSAVLASGLPDAVRRLALQSTSALTTTVGAVLASNLSDAVKRVALRDTSALTTTVSAVLASGLPEAVKRLALQNTTALTTTVSAVLASSLPAEIKTLALQTGNLFTATVRAVLSASTSSEAKALALNATNTLTATVGGVLSSGLPDAVKRLALQSANALTTTVSAVVSSALPDAAKRLALQDTSSLLTTVSAVLASTVPDEVKRLALAGAGSYSVAVSGVLSSTMPADVKALLVNASTSASRAVILSAALGTALTADQRTLLAAQDATIKRVVQAALAAGALTTDQRALLLASNATVSRTVQAALSASSLTADQRALLLAQDATISRVVTQTLQSPALTDDQRALLNAVSAGNVNATISFNENDPLKSIWNGILYASKSTYDLLEKASNGSLGLYVSLARSHNANGVVDIGTNIWRAASLWGGAAPAVRLAGVSGYASGGDFGGGVRMVGENGPELEFTGPSRIYSAGQTAAMLQGGNQTALVALVAALVAELQGLRGEQAAGLGAVAAAAQKSNKLLDRVTDGGTAMLTTAA